MMRMETTIHKVGRSIIGFLYNNVLLTVSVTPTSTSRKGKLVEDIYMVNL